MADAEEYESVLCVKPEVHVYRVPPRASNRGYRLGVCGGFLAQVEREDQVNLNPSKGQRKRQMLWGPFVLTILVLHPPRAAEWQLDQPAWSGRMRITAKGSVAYIKLEDKNSGELFAQAPVEQFPSIAVEGVTDSSRYFVIRIEDGNGRRAFIGVGFVDRGDAFDFNVALQDHFKWVKQQSELARQAQNPDRGPKLDLGFKEGQTIKLNIANVKKKEGSAGSRMRTVGSGGPSLIPPPPGGRAAPLLAPPPPGEQLPSHPTVLPSEGPPQAGASVLWPPQPRSSTAEAAADIWGDFAKASGSLSSQTSQDSSGWVQF